jgi:hypothetical protein
VSDRAGSISLYLSLCSSHEFASLHKVCLVQADPDEPLLLSGRSAATSLSTHARFLRDPGPRASSELAKLILIHSSLYVVRGLLVLQLIEAPRGVGERLSSSLLRVFRQSFPLPQGGEAGCGFCADFHSLILIWEAVACVYVALWCVMRCSHKRCSMMPKAQTSSASQRCPPFISFHDPLLDD